MKASSRLPSVLPACMPISSAGVPSARFLEHIERNLETFEPEELRDELLTLVLAGGVIQAAAERLQLSGRAVHRVQRVARTIAEYRAADARSPVSPV